MSETKCTVSPAAGTTGTSVEFWPDLKRFNLTKIEQVYSDLMYQRLLCLSIIFPNIKFSFNGKRIKTTDKNFLKLFNENIVYQTFENGFVGVIPNTQDDFTYFTYVNGLHFMRGGNHIDYIAGEISRDITNRKLLPEDIRKAHEEGLIHFHDADYFVQRMFNCCLVNLEDMLQNGTVINGTLVEKPHSFATACNIATQIMAQIASCQYGGQSESLSHLAPFVDVSRQRIKKEVLNEYIEFTGHEPRDEADYDEYMDIVEKRVRDEVRRGVQTIQYQINTLMTTNGQAPFVTIFMYLNEVKDEQTKRDLAIIIEEVLTQRLQGVKNEKGVWVTPAFPKLIYVLEEDNVKEGSKFFYLTQLAAKCTAKRMVPDYISEKKMLEYKIDKNGEGHCYTCMGLEKYLSSCKIF